MAIFKCAGRKRQDADGQPFCAHEAPTRWLGRCPGCGRYYDCEKVGSDKKTSSAGTLASLANAKPPPRISTGYSGFDEVLGGGLVKGSSVIISGPPGTGKTTLLLGACQRIAMEGHEVMYGSGEQSVDDIGLTAHRIGSTSERVHVMGLESDIYKITDRAAEVKATLLVLDSLQTMAKNDVSADIGSAEQCRVVADYVSAWCKEQGIACIIVAHINKAGDLAGPKAAEHLVDAILELDPAVQYDEDGEIKEETRNLVKLTSGKNRFGATGVEAKFKMTGEGMKGQRKPSPLTLVKRDDED